MSLVLFLERLKKSQVLESDVVEELPARSACRTPAELACWLTSHEMLTPWQARMLLDGKWKGMVLGSFVVEEPLTQDHRSYSFRARRASSMERVVLHLLRDATDVPHYLALGALRLPGLVRIHGVESVETRLIAVMDLVPGESLQSRLERQAAPLPRGMVRQIAGALRELHRRGLTFGDLRPGTIMLGADDRVTLLLPSLWGSTYVQNNWPFLPTHRRICLPGGRVEPCHDVLALGALLYRLLTGQPAYPLATARAAFVAWRLFEFWDGKPIPQEWVRSEMRHCSDGPPATDQIPTTAEALGPLCIDLLRCEPSDCDALLARAAAIDV